MPWSSIELYYEHSLAGLVATSEVAGYPVANLLNRIDGNLWKATSTATQYITFDAGVGNTYSPDYLLLHLHNLHTAGATIVLQYSTDNFAADVNDIFTAYAPADDNTILKLFTTQAKRYWRLKISGATVAPWIALGHWGPRTVLDHADALTPYDLTNKGVVNVGGTGIVQGIHDTYTEYALQIKFFDADAALVAKVRAWEEAVGLGLFGISWDPGDHATDVRMMRRKDGKFKAPLKVGGTYADLTLDLIGRKE